MSETMGLGRHLSEAELVRFLAAEMPWEEAMVAGLHLYGCAACRERLAAAAPERGPQTLERLFAEIGVSGAAGVDAYDAVFAEAGAELLERQRRFAEEEARAPDLYAELRREPAGERRRRVREEARFHTWALAELLLDLCRDTWSDDPAWAEELAELAVLVFAAIPEGEHPAELLNDARARAWAYIGNARRIRSDLRRVEEAFEIAEQYLKAGTGEAFEQARLLDLKSSLLRAQRRFGEAEKLLEKVVATYRRGKDRHLEGRALMKLAKLNSDRSEPELAVGLLRKAITLMDVQRDPLLLFRAMKNLAAHLNEAGYPEQAVDMLPALAEIAHFGSWQDQARLRWVEGLIFASLSRVQEAEAAFRGAREAFVGHGIGYDAALVSLDLAALLLRERRTAEIKQLALEIGPLFEAQDIHREALAALAIFQQALAIETATPALVEEIAGYLKKARRNPLLRFRSN